MIDSFSSMIKWKKSTHDGSEVEVLPLEVSLAEKLSGDERGHAALDGPGLGDGGEVAHRHEHGAQQPAPLLASAPRAQRRALRLH